MEMIIQLTVEKQDWNGHQYLLFILAMLQNNVMKRLKEKLTLNERERSSLLGSIYEEYIK